MNKRFIIINFAAFAVMLFLSTGCKQDGKQDAVPSYRVITVSSMPVEISESYSATIRGRQDVDIMPQISGRITRLCVKVMALACCHKQHKRHEHKVEYMPLHKGENCVHRCKQTFDEP